MSTRNDRFNASMRSLDELTASFEDPSKADVFSDKGLGVERMAESVDVHLREAASRRLNEDGAHSLQSGETPLPPCETPLPQSEPTHVRKRKLHVAEMRLYRAGCGYLVPVLRLIAENGSARHFSLEKISRAQYFRHRDALLRFFS